MEHKPEYRFECRIIDTKNGEEIITASTFVGSHTDIYGGNESIDIEVSSMMRAFKQKYRAKYEQKNYQLEEVTA